MARTYDVCVYRIAETGKFLPKYEHRTKVECTYDAQGLSVKIIGGKLLYFADLRLLIWSILAACFIVSTCLL